MATPEAGDVEKRDEAETLAPVYFAAAEAVANEIGSPWYRCQALGWVARFAPDDQVMRLARDALRTSLTTDDPYQQAGASAWPLRALVERGHENYVEEAIPAVLAITNRVESLASRSEALFLLLQAVLPAKRGCWLPVFDALRAASQPMLHWRQGRNIRDACVMIASGDLTLAESACEEIADERVRQRTRKDLDGGARGKPRAFFWNKG